MWGGRSNYKEMCELSKQKANHNNKKQHHRQKKTHLPLLGTFPFSFLSGRERLDPYGEERLGYEFMLLDMDILFYDACNSILQKFQVHSPS